MYIAAARVTLLLHGSFSLKDKRRALLRLKDRLRHRFHTVAVAEVADQDVWNRAVVGLAAVSGDAVHARDMVEKSVRFVDELQVGEVVDDEVELLQI